MRTFIVHLEFFLCLCFICHAQDISAQGLAQNKNRFIRKLQKTIWIAGVSGTVIDDDGKAFKDLFNVNNTWNFVYFPSKINFEGYVLDGLSVETSLSYCQLKKGKLIGNENLPRSANVNLIAFDVNAKFYPIELLRNTNTFSPYAISGLGYTYRSLSERKSALTFNFGFGLNIWIYKGFGMNIQSMAKFALNNASSKNYLQHSVGVIYRFSFLMGSKIPRRSDRRYNLFMND